MRTTFVDTHCHLYLQDFKEDLDLILERADRENISEFYLPAIDSSTYDDMLALEGKFPGKCHSMIGLHPCSVKENYMEELRFVEQSLIQRKFAAVGEIGLDFYWDLTFKKQQESAFHQQIDWALHYNHPIVIHSRNSINECIDIVQNHSSGNMKGIFHCFSGTFEQATRIIETGLYLGIGGVITYKNAGLAEVVSKISLDHIVLETDSPYLAPVPFRGKRNESSYLKYVVEKIAGIKSISADEVGAVTTLNAQKIFSS